MGTVMVRVSEATRDRLKEMASADGESIQAVVDEAVDSYRKARYVEATNAAYAALKADPEARQEELEERRLWETTLMDGIDAGERWDHLEGATADASDA